MRIAAFKGRSFVSQLIKFQSRSQYSHVAMVNGDGTVFESWASGGVLHNSSLSRRHTPGTEIDIFSFARPLTHAQEKAMRAEAYGHLGKGYDWRSVFRFITRRDAPPDDNKTLFCSEYVIIVCLAGQQELFARTPPWIVPPDWVPRSPLLVYSETITTI